MLTHIPRFEHHLRRAKAVVLREPSCVLTRHALQEKFWVIESSLAVLRFKLKANFNPLQPRAPTGNSNGGQWVGTGGSLSDSERFRILDPDLEAKPAQFRPRGGGSGRFGTRFPDATSGQQVRHALAEANAREAIRRVREVDPNFKEPQSLTETIEGEITHYNAIARTAKERLSHVTSMQLQSNWRMGTKKSSTQWANRMQERGWTSEQINEAITRGQKSPTYNNIVPRNGATAYTHPQTGRKLALDNLTREVIHIGGDNFDY